MISAVDFYFIEEDGTRFKATYAFMPYFYILTKREYINEISQFLIKKYGGTISKCAVVEKDDLDLVSFIFLLESDFMFRNLLSAKPFDRFETKVYKTLICKSNRFDKSKERYTEECEEE